MMGQSAWSNQSKSKCAGSTMFGVIPLFIACGIQYVKEVGIAWLVLSAILKGLIVLIIGVRGILRTRRTWKTLISS